MTDQEVLTQSTDQQIHVDLDSETKAAGPGKASDNLFWTKRAALGILKVSLAAPSLTFGSILLVYAVNSGADDAAGFIGLAFLAASLLMFYLRGWALVLASVLLTLPTAAAIGFFWLIGSMGFAK